METSNTDLQTQGGQQIQESRDAGARMMALKSMVEQNSKALQSVATKYLTPDRLMKVVLVSASRTPRLLECSPMSIVRAMMDASEVGLEPNTPMKRAYLIPRRNNKTKQVEAQFEPSYMGLCDLVRRSGEVSTIEAHPVYEEDEFSFELGSNKHLKHRPKLSGERGDPFCFYAHVRFKDGSEQFDVMTMREIERIEVRSQSSDNGPWQTDFIEMAKKTVIKRITKLLPQSAELARAIELDNQQYGNEFESRVAGIPSDQATTVADINAKGASVAADQELQKACGEFRRLVEKIGPAKASSVLGITVMQVASITSGRAKESADEIWSAIDVLRDNLQPENNQTEPPKTTRKPRAAKEDSSTPTTTSPQPGASVQTGSAAGPVPPAAPPPATPSSASAAHDIIARLAANLRPDETEVAERLKELNGRMLRSGDEHHVVAAVRFAREKGRYTEIDSLIESREPIPFGG